MSKKIKFNEDGTTTTIHQEHSENILISETNAASSTGKGKKELSQEEQEKKAEKRKRKFERMVQAENEYLSKKYNIASAADSSEQTAVQAEDTAPINPDNATTLATDTSKEDAPKDLAKEEKVEEEVETPAISKAKTAALEYLQTFTKDRSQWKFQKVRQIWLLQNMYFSKQMDNDQFKDLLAYLKGMGEKQRKITIQEAKDILESADTVSDTTKKRAKKIIKLL